MHQQGSVGSIQFVSSVVLESKMASLMPGILAGTVSSLSIRSLLQGSWTFFTCQLSISRMSVQERISQLPVSSGLSLEAGTIVTFRSEQAQSPPKFKWKDKNLTSQWEECVKVSEPFLIGHTEDQLNLILIFLGWRWYCLFRFESPPPEVTVLSLLGHLNFRDFFFFLSLLFCCCC